MTVIETRLATASDAGAVVVNVTEGFETYRVWAPDDWAPPAIGEGNREQFAATLARPDVWFLIAMSDGQAVVTSLCR
jgi:hypothetical protein